MVRESRPPLVYELAKYMTRHGIRGGQRLLNAINRSGMMERNVVYKIDRKISVVIPMHLSFSYKFFDSHVLANYEKEVVTAIAAEAGSLPAPVTYVDCGADIGLFAGLVAARTPCLSQIIAFEPNPTVREYLARNLAGLSVPSQINHVAVSDFNGSGILRSPSNSKSVHARFLEPAPDGDIAVRTIDSFHLAVPGGLILKIDVEGGELNVIKGALETLRRAPEFAVVFEAHPDVIRRTGLDPMECIRLLGTVRDCRAHICELPSISLDINRDYLEQHPTEQVFDIMCRST